MLELNKIYNGDCIEIMKDIDDESIDLILTDPPYSCVSNKSKDFFKGGAFERTHFQKIYDFEKQVDFEDYMYLLIDEFNRIGKEFSYLVFFWNKIDKISYVINYATEKYKNHLRVGNFIWLKTNPMPNLSRTNLLSNIEHCSVIQKKKGKGHFNYYNYDFMHNYYISSNYVENRKHPTQKPLELIEKFVMIYSNKGDTILDPFLGSGTTAEASFNTKRKYIGIELNKEYFDIATKRLYNLSLQKPLFN